MQDVDIEVDATFGLCSSLHDRSLLSIGHPLRSRRYRGESMLMERGEEVDSRGKKNSFGRVGRSKVAVEIDIGQHYRRTNEDKEAKTGQSSWINASV